MSMCSNMILKLKHSLKINYKSTYIEIELGIEALLTFLAFKFLDPFMNHHVLV
jgi:hypothetical protein